MNQLQDDRLVFSFPEIEAQLQERVRDWVDAKLKSATVAERARLPESREELCGLFMDRARVRAAVSFQRTLRIPDDGNDYPLPPGLGRFPVRKVDAFPGAPDKWKGHGELIIPVHKTEALWLQFEASYPMAMKVGSGGVCAISGARSGVALFNPPQNYVVLPAQPWLDGFRVEEGIIRQFVAVPMDKGLTVESEVTGEETRGGLQLQAFPMLLEEYCRRELVDSLEWRWKSLIDPLPILRDICYCMGESSDEAGLGAGGRMRQKITADPYGLACWDAATTSDCTVRLCLADDWLRLTGTPPPHKPPSAQVYSAFGLPWFDYDNGIPAVAGETVLSTVKSVNALMEEKVGLSLSNNSSVLNPNVVQLTGKSPVVE